MVKTVLAIFFALLSVHASVGGLRWETELSQPSYAVGDTVTIGIRCAIPEHFHLYSNPLGPGIGKPLHITAENTARIDWLDARRMGAQKFTPDMGDWVWAFEKNTVFFVRGVMVGAGTEAISVTLSIDGLICHTSCIPFDTSLFVSVKQGEGSDSFFSHDKDLEKAFMRSVPMDLGTRNTAPQERSIAGLDLSGLKNLSDSNHPAHSQDLPDWDYTAVEKKDSITLWLAIVFAFLAGLILNVMPCVLPVLGIKILSFSQSAGESRSQAVLHSVFFSAGMISIFLVLATFAAFAGFSWGEQFQRPEMLTGIIAVMFVFSLGLFDVYTLLVPSGVGALERKAGGLSGEFIKGMVTTILATPCSGPFLGATLAWTLRQTPVTIYLIFTFLGCGMAAPYILLSTSKNVAKILPKPGQWMNDLKHILGFILIGFAVYLMIGLPSDYVISTVALCVFCAGAIAAYGRLAPFGAPPQKILIAASVAAVIALGGWYVSFPVLRSYYFAPPQTAEAEMELWQTFSTEKLRNAHANGQNVLIDFTANWCMNCQFNKVTVLHSPSVMKLMENKDVLALRVDLTNDNPVGESLMEHLGSRSVPFLAIFPGDNPYEPVIMRDVLSKKRLVTTLNMLPSR